LIVQACNREVTKQRGLQTDRPANRNTSKQTDLQGDRFPNVVHPQVKEVYLIR